MKKTLPLVLLATVAAAAAYFLTRPPAPDTSGKLLPGFSPERVAGLRISGGGATATLRAGEGGWSVAERGDFPADTQKIAGLLRAAWEMRPVQSFPATAEDLAALDLLAQGSPSGGESPQAPGADERGAGLYVSFLDENSRELDGLVLGKHHFGKAGADPFGPLPMGRYVRRSGDTEHAALVAETFDDIVAEPAAWLDKSLPPIPSPKAIRRRVPGGGAVAWEIVRDGGSWKPARAVEGKEFDEAAARAVASAVAGLSFKDVAPEEAFAPELEVEVTSESGDVYSIAFGKEKDGMVPMRITPARPPDGEKAEVGRGSSAEEPSTASPRFPERTLLAPSHAAEPFSKEADSFFKNPPPEKGAQEMGG